MSSTNAWVDAVNKLIRHLYFSEDTTFPLGHYFEIHDGGISAYKTLKIMYWVFEHVTDRFSVTFYEYYTVIEFASEHDALLYKLTWCEE